MEDQGKQLENDSPDLSSLEQNHEKQSDPQEAKGQGALQPLKPVLLSDEEKNIRIELENEIERGLEEELKQSICHLALRLYSLYQHQKERKRKNRFIELNVTIRMEGESMIEIHAMKKGNCDKLRTLSPVPSSLKQPSAGGFNWAKTLRSSPTSTMINQKTERTETPHRSWRVTGSNCAALHIKRAGSERRNIFPREVNNLLQLGWRK